MAADAPRADPHSRGAQTALAAALVALWVVTFLRALTAVFVLNFSTAGPNATVLATALLVTGWTLPVAGALGRRFPRAWPALVPLGAGAALATLGVDTGPALLAAVAAQLLLAPALAAAVGALRERFAVAAALGVAGHHALRAWLDTAPPHATPAGAVALGVVALVALAAWTVLVRRGALPGPAAGPAAPAAAFLLVEAAFVGLPPVVALWGSRSGALAVGASAAGLLAGAAWVHTRRTTRPAAAAAGLAFLAAVAGLLALGAPGVAVLAAPAQAGAVLLLARGSRAARPRRVGTAVAAVQVAGLLAVFLHVGALNWAFVPDPVGALTRGRAALFLLLAGAVFPATVLVDELARREATDAPVPSPDGDRRAVLASAGAGLLALAGVGVRDRARLGGTDGNGANADGSPPYGVVTYNVHQYFGADGGYNLRAVRDALSGRDPALVGLQETDGGRLTSGGVDGVGWLARELGYRACRGPATRRVSYGVALLSRWPVRGSRVVDLPTDDTPRRVALVAEVAAPDGPLGVVVAHLEVEGAVRVAQARRVVELADGFDRAVVLGDFNAEPGSRPHEVLAGAFADAWRVAGDGNGFTWSASNPERRIDYVFLRGGWAVDRAAVFGTPAASDHLAVGAWVDPGGRD